MNMKFINFTEEQFTKNISFLEKNSFFKDFISEYILLCDKEEGFKKRLDEGFNSADRKNTAKNINKIISSLEKIEQKIISHFKKVKIPDVIIFTGPCGWDGHGVIIKKKAFLFLNMTRFNSIMSEKDHCLKTHLTHELIHAIHYSYSPQFYPLNFTGVKDYFFKKMYAEGLSTYLSQKINETDEKTALSFGLMNENDFLKWVGICESLKKDIYSSIKKSIDTGEKDKNLWNRLFSVPDLDPGCLMRGRYGYYYGLKIAGTAGEKMEEERLLYIKENTMSKIAKAYFE